MFNWTGTWKVKDPNYTAVIFQAVDRITQNKPDRIWIGYIQRNEKGLGPIPCLWDSKGICIHDNTLDLIEAIREKA